MDSTENETQIILSKMCSQKLWDMIQINLLNHIQNLQQEACGWKKKPGQDPMICETGLPKTT